MLSNSSLDFDGGVAASSNTDDFSHRRIKSCFHILADFEERNWWAAASPMFYILNVLTAPDSCAFPTGSEKASGAPHGLQTVFHLKNVAPNPSCPKRPFFSAGGLRASLMICFTAILSTEMHQLEFQKKQNTMWVWQ